MLSPIYSSLVLMLLASFSGVGNAVPLGFKKRAVSAAVFDQLEFFSQYSAAAYCFANNNSPNTKIACAQGNCPRVEAANTNTLTEFENTGENDATGFVATDTTNQLTVISFRGSASLENWLANVNFGLEDFDFCANCQAHNGFKKTWDDSRQGVLAAVNRAKQQFPNFKVVATGHSLGGAVASLATAELRSTGMTVDLYTYGAPKSGNEELSAFLDQDGNGENFRVVHDDDPIPKLPPRVPVVLEYEHTNPEFFIAADKGLTTTAADITQLGVGADDGNSGTRVQAHLEYFGRISLCEGGETIDTGSGGQGTAQTGQGAAAQGVAQAQQNTATQQQQQQQTTNNDSDSDSDSDIEDKRSLRESLSQKLSRRQLLATLTGLVQNGDSDSEDDGSDSDSNQKRSLARRQFGFSLGFDLSPDGNSDDSDAGSNSDAEKKRSLVRRQRRIGGLGTFRTSQNREDDQVAQANNQDNQDDSDNDSGSDSEIEDKRSLVRRQRRIGGLGTFRTSQNREDDQVAQANNQDNQDDSDNDSGSDSEIEDKRSLVRRQRRIGGLGTFRTSQNREDDQVAQANNQDNQDDSDNDSGSDSEIEDKRSLVRRQRRIGGLGTFRTSDDNDNVQAAQTNNQDGSDDESDGSDSDVEEKRSLVRRQRRIGGFSTFRTNPNRVAEEEDPNNDSADEGSGSDQDSDDD